MELLKVPLSRQMCCSSEISELNTGCPLNRLRCNHERNYIMQEVAWTSDAQWTFDAARSNFSGSKSQGRFDANQNSMGRRLEQPSALARSTLLTVTRHRNDYLCRLQFAIGWSLMHVDGLCMAVLCGPDFRGMKVLLKDSVYERDAEQLPARSTIHEMRSLH